MTEIYRSRAVGFAAAVLGTAAITAAFVVLLGRIEDLPVHVAMLLAGVFVAGLWGRWSGTAAAALCTLCLHLLAVNRVTWVQARTWTSLAVFFLVAVVVAQLGDVAKRLLRTKSDAAPSASFVVNRLLHDRHRGEHCKSCYRLRDVARKVDETARNIAGKAHCFKVLVVIVLLALPLISAIISFLTTATGPEPWRKEVVMYLSWAVTLLTVLNSLFRPRERFAEACKLGIGIQELKDRFISRIEELTKERSQPQETLHRACDHFEKELEPIETALIGMFLPEAGAEGEKQASHKGEHPARDEQHPGKPARKHALVKEKRI